MVHTHASDPASTLSGATQDSATGNIAVKKAGSPINLLPFEVMALILKEAIPGVPAPYDGWLVRSTLRLCMVCRAWRNVLLRTAQCWADVRVGQLDLARLCVQRSQQVNIAFHILEPRPIGERRCYATEAANMLTEAANLVINNIKRVHALEVHIFNKTFSSVMLRLVNLQAPVLRSLEICNTPLNICMDFGDAPKYFCLFPTAPLRRLVVEGLSIQNPIKIHAQWQLTSLEVRLHPESDHSSHVLLETLRACPRLDDLKIEMRASIVPVGRAEEKAVILENLRNLEFQLPMAHDASYLLRCIDSPNILRVELQIRKGQHLGYAPAEEILPMNNMLRDLPESLRQSPTHVSFVAHKKSLRIKAFDHAKCEGDQELLKVRLPCVECWSSTFPRSLSEKLLQVLPRLSTASFREEIGGGSSKGNNDDGYETWDIQGTSQES